MAPLRTGWCRGPLRATTLYSCNSGNGVTPKRHSACGACSLPSHAPQTNCYKGSARGTHGQTDGQTWLPGGFWRAALLVFHPSVDALLLMCYLHGYPRWLSSDTTPVCLNPSTCLPGSDYMERCPRQGLKGLRVGRNKFTLRQGHKAGAGVGKGPLR